MDIKNLNNPSARANDATRSVTGGAAAAVPGTETRPGDGRGSTRSDAVTLTPVARDLAAMGTDAPFDRDRVDAIKDAIERGEYAVDPDRIAQAIIELDDL